MATSSGIVDVRSDDFKRLQVAMRGASKDLYNDFRRELRRTLGYARDDIRDDWGNVDENLPFSIKGGDKNILSTVSSRSARISAAKSTTMTTLNRGFARHPVFGDRSQWVSQNFSSATGWWEQAVTKELPRIVQQSQLTITHFTEELARKISSTK